MQETAISYGVNPAIALYIVEHESGGDVNASHTNQHGSVDWGLWQFNDRNKGFSLACAKDMVCSTNLAMNWILAGKLYKWVSWDYRCLQENAINCPQFDK